MRGLSKKERSYGRSPSSCSFCRSRDHQVNKCPHVPIVWQSLLKGKIPLSYLNTNSLPRWYSNGTNWGDLYRNAQRAYAMWERAQDRSQNKTSKKRTKKCGYCGDTGHTRRTCTDMKAKMLQLNQANQKFREWFYKEYVEKQGLSTGAIVEIETLRKTEPRSWNSDTVSHKFRTVVTAINWDSINLFSTLDVKKVRDHRTVSSAGADAMDSMGDFLTSPVLLKVPDKTFEKNGIEIRTNWHYSSTQNQSVPFPIISGEPVTRTYRQVCDFETQAPMGSSYGDGNPVKSVTIVSRAPQTLPDDWVNGYGDEMGIIFKKFNEEQLAHYGVLEHIAKWANI